jgi:hypothetical protein
MLEAVKVREIEETQVIPWKQHMMMIWDYGSLKGRLSWELTLIYIKE